jgi:hypothetical protein
MIIYKKFQKDAEPKIERNDGERVQIRFLKDEHRDWKEGER